MHSTRLRSCGRVIYPYALLLAFSEGVRKTSEAARLVSRFVSYILESSICSQAGKVFNRTLFFSEILFRIFISLTNYFP